MVRANMRGDPDGAIAKFYERLRRKKGPQKAIAAASAKMLRIIYCVWGRGGHMQGDPIMVSGPSAATVWGMRNSPGVLNARVPIYTAPEGATMGMTLDGQLAFQLPPRGREGRERGCGAAELSTA